MTEKPEDIQWLKITRSHPLRVNDTKTLPEAVVNKLYEKLCSSRFNDHMPHTTTLAVGRLIAGLRDAVTVTLQKTVDFKEESYGARLNKPVFFISQEAAERIADITGVLKEKENSYYMNHDKPKKAVGPKTEQICQQPTENTSKSL